MAHKTQKHTEEDEFIITDIATAVKEQDEEDRKYQENKRKLEEEAEGQEDKDDPKNTKKLLIALGIIFMIFAAAFIAIKITKQNYREPTIDELHQLNAQGKLDPVKGYIYNGFSFINYAGLWHSRVQQGNTLYDITFNNDPKSVENITVEGQLSERFSKDKGVYITFDPDAQGMKYIAVANAGLSMSLAKGFHYNLTAGCTSNQSGICRKKGVITCDDDDKAVIYFKEAVDTKVILDDNCVTIQGYGPEIIRAKDRLLMRWYGIMQQEGFSNLKIKD